MASLKDIRTRIKSVKNTQKITKAMKMVAAAKLRRAQEAVEAARPYADKVHGTVSALAKRAETLGETPHPLLTVPEKTRNIEIIVLTSDRGLCGGFNSNTVRRAERFAFDEKENFEKLQFSTIGRKGFESLRKGKTEIRMNYQDVFSGVSFAKAKEVADEICEFYQDVDQPLDGVYLLYNEFKNAAVQKLTLKQLLPVTPVEVEEDLVDYEYEPSRDELLDDLLPTHFAMQLYRSILESIASEHGARMTAMESATNNARDMCDALTLQYNRARQAAITTELMEIIGGAEALK